MSNSPKTSPAHYGTWVEGLRDGRSYCGDGMSHLFDFGPRPRQDRGRRRAGRRRAGESTGSAQPGRTAWNSMRPPSSSRSPPQRRQKSRTLAPTLNPTGHRTLSGRRVATRSCRDHRQRSSGREKGNRATGSTNPLSFDVDIPQSAWVAALILPSVHTQLIFVHVDGKPIRAGKASAVAPPL